MSKINVNFNDYTVEELTDAQTELRVVLKTKKDEAKKNAKANKDADKAAKDAAGKAFVEAAGKDATITVVYKGEEVVGKITKISDKTVGVIVNIDGEDKEIWRYFRDVVVTA